MDRRAALITGAVGLTAISTISAALAADPSSSAQATAADTELDEIGTLLADHDLAFSNHDLPGVMACLTDTTMIMGTGPGEVWAGPEEIQYAYENFFRGFDKGENVFDYQFRVGGKSPEAGWLMTSGVVTAKKDGKEFSYPLNVSLNVTKSDGSWKIAGLHFSTDPGKEPSKD